MTTLSKPGMLPLLAALAAVLSIGGAVAVKYLMKYLKRLGELNKRRKARLSLLASRPKDAPPPKITHLALYCLPDLQDGMEARVRLGNIVEKMNAAYPCASVQLANYGGKMMNKQSLLGFLGKPDMSLFMTHCLFITADDINALKLVLHSNLHKGEYFAVGGPYCRGIVETTTDLGVDLNPEGKADPMLQFALLKFKPEVTDDSEVYQAFLKAVAEIDKFPGIAASLKPVGHNTLIKEDLLTEVDWKPDSYFGTHLFTVVADSPEDLKQLQSSEAYGKWLMTEMPHLVQDQGQSALLFHAPLKLTVTC